ncbi:putative WRKY transcription factor 19 [Cocos nucifera]|uniref:Putative WRKY transcription factor 19 n=1 Tax=Cocos nucifera TaxID=13894 RepID=A0A8K0I2D0_COCNU|nr:putative WRKY transcription factor 19 [Cocos nucifera]
MPALLFAPMLENADCTKGSPENHNLLDLGSSMNANHHQHHHFLQHELQVSPEPIAATDSSVDITSGCPPSGPRTRHQPKKCMFNGCSRGARGASGLCIAHGGGQRCQKPGCNKGAESRTAFCKAHGGGRRCQMLGCTKSAEGKTEFCIAHGGGRRCDHPRCTKAARGKSGLCIRHGGGKRCTVEGCSRSAEGQAGLCISHGGGRRCQHPGCGKGAQGSTRCCKAHGGGKRCIFEGCTKGAEGSTPLCKGHGGGKRCLFEGGGVCPKSVHGGTNFCVAHGGGKRCAMPGCTKSARGRTEHCVRHGGGKRCHFEGCGKSAQGSTDFCKAHGGGKRCTWGSGCDKFARGRSGLCAAHGRMKARQESEAGKSGSMIGPGLFQGIVYMSAMAGSSTDEDCSTSGASAVSDCTESLVNGRRQLLIPPQVLVPASMKSPSSASASVGVGSLAKSSGFMIPEGRVHGGSLMSLLGGSFKTAVDGGLNNLVEQSIAFASLLRDVDSLNVRFLKEHKSVASKPGIAISSLLIDVRIHVVQYRIGQSIFHTVHQNDVKSEQLDLERTLDLFGTSTIWEESYPTPFSLSVSKRERIKRGEIGVEKERETVEGFKSLGFVKRVYWRRRNFKCNRDSNSTIHVSSTHPDLCGNASDGHMAIFCAPIHASEQVPLPPYSLPTSPSGMTARTAVFFFCFANNTAYHDIHHQLQGSKYNYSQPFFSIWDKILGTYMPYSLVARQEGGLEARPLKD